MWLLAMSGLLQQTPKGPVLASTHTPTTIMATEEIGPCLRRGGEDYDRRRVSGKHTVHVFDIENDWARLPNPPSTLYSDRQERSSTRESTSTRKNRQIPTRKHKASLHSDKSEVTLDRGMQRREPRARTQHFFLCGEELGRTKKYNWHFIPSQAVVNDNLNTAQQFERHREQSNMGCMKRTSHLCTYPQKLSIFALWFQ